MTKRISIFNGPNLNLLGEREPDIYGSVTLKAIEDSCRSLAETLNIKVDFHQTNHEGVMVDSIQAARLSSDALIINPAGLSFHSVPVLDSLRIFGKPIVELHLSNIHARDDAHRHSIMSGSATAVICGLGAYGYIVALQAAARALGPLADGLPEPLRIGPV
ncbi:MAG: 3-dehydroquinate dehydratase [Paracoccaceae bacterium]|nr:3-dehydroquinate dehydratase [Paracoccaceae bacterium]